jgi:hypothetical protein
MVMENIIIKDLKKLISILENQCNYKYYYNFIPKVWKIVDARVKMYPHPNGSVVTGMKERQWVYIELVCEEGPCYDVALWKLMYTDLFAELLKSGAVEIED